MINNRGINISRVPSKTREEFCQYAKDEWADDRGALLTYLWKFFKGECSSGHEEINAKIDYLHDEIAELKTSLPKANKKIEHRLDGKTIEKVEE